MDTKSRDLSTLSHMDPGHPDEIEASASPQASHNDVDKMTAADNPATTTTDSPASSKKDRQPYENPDRVKTGGQREKMSPEELAEKLEKMRLQNAAIKQRRQQVDADKEAFSQSMEIERQKASEQAELQLKVNRSREAIARRKEEHKGSREWDAEKGVRERTADSITRSSQFDARDRGRGRGRDRGRGRGRGWTASPVEGNLSETSGPNTKAKAEG